MIEFLQINENTLWWLTAFSIATFIATLVLVPWLVVNIPFDYFAGSPQRVDGPQRLEGPQRVEGRQPMEWHDQHPLIRALLLLGKNILGVFFVVIGIILLVLPGQGLLTILVGIMLLNFPGKYRLLRWIIKRPPIRHSIDWLRQRAERAPLVID